MRPNQIDVLKSYPCIPYNFILTNEIQEGLFTKLSYCNKMLLDVFEE